MRPESERQEVLRLADLGINDCEISTRTDIPRSTVREMRHGRDRPRGGSRAGSNCPRCEPRAIAESEYSYLLGAYLGDGHIVKLPRAFRLTVFCDLLYVHLALEIARAMREVRGGHVALRPEPAEGVLLVQAYWKHWPCLFPQHGPGRKHERPIVLEPWQQAIVDADPQQFLRGLIHSDGCRSTNTIRHPKRTYTYPRYQFTNHSDDIRRLFCDTCDAIGVRWTRMNRWTISVARREHVAALDTFIGPKT